MKIAKVNKKGVITHVWPDIITKKDGRVIHTEIPLHVLSYEKKGLPLPDHFVEVPDEVRPHWVWHEDLQAYAPRIKRIPPKITPHSDLLEVVAEKLGLHHDDLMAEVMARKKARKAKPVED